MGAGPRERLITEAIALVSERGVHGAGMAELLDRSRASRNSLYQHFPRGKGELVETATRIAGAQLGAGIDAVTARGEPRHWLGALVGGWTSVLQSSSFAAGCPIMAAALDVTEPHVQIAAGDAFTDWATRLATALTTAGFPADSADSFAGFAISALEGAILQSRATRSVQPLNDVATQLTLLFDHHIAQTRGDRSTLSKRVRRDVDDCGAPTRGATFTKIERD